MKPTLIFATAICFLCIQTRAEDVEYYSKAAMNFIAKNKTEDSEKKWETYWKGRLKTAATDREEDEESFIDRYVYDWMAGKVGQKTLSVEDKLIACRVYLIYKNKNWDGTVRRPSGGLYKIPDRIAEHLTNENLDKFISDDSALMKKVVGKEVKK